jgi:translation factor GUF1, mitochondrial
MGILNPFETPTTNLYTGQVGYINCDMKSTKEAKIGDTIFLTESLDDNDKPFPGFKKIKPVVFSGIYPVDNTEYDKLKESIDKLLLTDSSVTVEKETSLALGNGFRIGFHGMLHCEIFVERLDNEFDSDVIMTNPTVTYKIILKKDNKVLYIDNPSEYPDEVLISETYEPVNFNIKF